MSKSTADTTVKGEKAQELPEEQVRLAAYYLWEEKGKNLGSDTDDWFEAEKIVNN